MGGVLGAQHARHIAWLTVYHCSLCLHCTREEEEERRKEEQRGRRRWDFRGCQMLLLLLPCIVDVVLSYVPAIIGASHVYNVPARMQLLPNVQQH